MTAARYSFAADGAWHYAQPPFVIAAIEVQNASNQAVLVEDSAAAPVAALNPGTAGVLNLPIPAQAIQLGSAVASPGMIVITVYDRPLPGAAYAGYVSLTPYTPIAQDFTVAPFGVLTGTLPRTRPLWMPNRWTEKPGVTTADWTTNGNGAASPISIPLYVDAGAGGDRTLSVSVTVNTATTEFHALFCADGKQLNELILSIYDPGAAVPWLRVFTRINGVLNTAALFSSGNLGNGTIFTVGASLRGSTLYLSGVTNGSTDAQVNTSLTIPQAFVGNTFCGIQYNQLPATGVEAFQRFSLTYP